MTQAEKGEVFFWVMLMFGVLIGVLVYFMIQDPKPAIRFCGYIIGIVAIFIGLWIMLYAYFGLNLLSMF